jgi:uncharacterized protein
VRRDLTFDSHGTVCEAWFYRPAADGPVPCVVIAHGFDGVRGQRLDAYAERFADAGLASFVFDYRCFGDSKGEPRQLYDNAAQLEDWWAAIATARGRDDVDGDRIALWGTSTSGGHVIELAAHDRRIAAVVTQVPLVDGFAQLRSTPFRQCVGLLWAGLKDRVGAALGRDAETIPAAGNPGTLAAVTSPDALSGLKEITPPKSTWLNEVVARFTLTTALYRPIRDATAVRCPVMICLADDDHVIPSAPALRMADEMAGRLNGGVALRRYPVGHFAMYYGAGFERAVADQTRFLTKHLEVSR